MGIRVLLFRKFTVIFKKIYCHNVENVINSPVHADEIYDQNEVDQKCMYKDEISCPDIFLKINFNVLTFTTS